MIPLTIGLTIDPTSLDYLVFSDSSFKKSGNKVSLNIGPCATAIGEFYKTIGYDLVFRAHNATKGEWRYWNGKYWTHYYDNDIRKDIKSLLSIDVVSRQVDEVINTMKLVLSISWDNFDKEPILALTNVVLRLQNGNLTGESYDKESYGTFALDVPLQKMDTPQWTTQINRLLPDEDDRKCLQEVFGASLFPSFKMQTMAAIVGKAGSGKSTITAILRDIIGPERVGSIQANQLSESHYLPSLVGKFINLDAESEFIKPEDEVILKRISGGDPVPINQKNQPIYNTVLHTKWVMVGEELPKFSSKTDGFWSRLVIIPFDVAIPPDEQLPMDIVLQKLRQEYPGIFFWALQGLKRLLSKTGTRGGAFTQSKRARDLHEAHKIYSNPFLEWWEEWVISDPSGTIDRTDLYNHYHRWATHGHCMPVHKAKFYKLVKNQGYEVTRMRVGQGTRTDQDRPRVYKGISISPN